MDEYKRSRMKNVLSAAGLNTTPELFTATAIVKAASVAVLAVPSIFVLPLLAPVALFLAVLIYFKEIRKADEALSAKRSRIEQELPRFVATITQELKASRDVLAILENFKKNAGSDFGAELDILTADMRSSSYEAALTRFEARFNSPMVATTATEAALYDQKVNGLLRSWMQSLTHKNLPLAMFLETSDLGYPA